MSITTQLEVGDPRRLTLIARQPVERTFTRPESGLISALVQLAEESWIEVSGTSSVGNWYFSTVSNMPENTQIFSMGLVEFRGPYQGFLLVVMVADMDNPDQWRPDGIELWKQEDPARAPMFAPKLHLRKLPHKDERFTKREDATVFTHFAFLGQMAQRELARRLQRLGLVHSLFEVAKKK